MYLYTVHNFPSALLTLACLISSLAHVTTASTDRVRRLRFDATEGRWQSARSKGRNGGAMKKQARSAHTRMTKDEPRRGDRICERGAQRNLRAGSDWPAPCLSQARAARRGICPCSALTVSAARLSRQSSLGPRRAKRLRISSDSPRRADYESRSLRAYRKLGF